MLSVQILHYLDFARQHDAGGVAVHVTPCISVGLQDGQHRWSMGPLYSMDSLEFLSHFFVREQSVAVDLDARIDMAALPCDEPRPR
jgi:hypothetical protein